MDLREAVLGCDCMGVVGVGVWVVVGGIVRSGLHRIIAGSC